tara:strand:+ start:6301 stop:6894 length:594 start_codon:yes stop_codon:yes gene_type:complete
MIFKWGILLLCFWVQTMHAVDTPSKNLELATFAGGCFWCMEPPYVELEGVISIYPGYTGGKEKDPTYKDVSAGKTSHLEAVQIQYDPKKVSYETLVDIFWRQIDPTDDGGQFADRGNHYKTAIFFHSEQQQKIALQSKETLDKSKRFDKPIVTSILKASTFYVAEEYHHKYYQKNPLHYNSYKLFSGRKPFIEENWK